MTFSCWTYKSTRNDALDLYVLEAKDFCRVPAALVEEFAPPPLVMKLSLTGNRKLARANPAEVLSKLRRQGRYLQLPPPPGADARPEP